ncbi:MAG: peptidylprolyl isomerase [Planctomycetaceae bacterium]|nr:peptidylprolyl isomerase [Planctomycetaceae bacterium]
MQVATNTVVAIDYTLTDDDGEVLDTSEGREPLSYLHGGGGIIPGLERELEGKTTGDEMKVSVSAADAYGERNEVLRQEVPRDQLAEIDDLEVGMQFRVDTNDGPMMITIVGLADDIVTIDGNHPLAGMALHFDVAVREVRDATEEEIAHGLGGHEH